MFYRFKAEYSIRIDESSAHERRARHGRTVHRDGGRGDRSASPDGPRKPEGPAPEVAVSLDMVKRGLIVAPVLVLVCALIWGSAGVWCSLYAIGLVLVNFALVGRDHRRREPHLARR